MAKKKASKKAAKAKPKTPNQLWGIRKEKVKPTPLSDETVAEALQEAKPAIAWATTPKATQPALTPEQKAILERWPPVAHSAIIEEWEKERLHEGQATAISAALTAEELSDWWNCLLPEERQWIDEGEVLYLEESDSQETEEPVPEEPDTMELREALQKLILKKFRFTPEEFAQITANRAATVGFCKGLRIYCEQEEIEEEEED